MSKFLDYSRRQEDRWGKKLQMGLLEKKFVPYFNSHRRIKVRFRCGSVKTGLVGASTGWMPVFLLMLRSDSLGSSWILSEKDQIIAVKEGKRYKEVK